MALCDKYAILGSKQMNVYNFDKFIENQDVLMGDDRTALEVTCHNVTAILPVISKSDLVKEIEATDGLVLPKPAVCFFEKNDPLFMVAPPVSEEEMKIYCPPPEKVFDMTDLTTMQEYVTKKEEYDNTVMALLETDPDDDSICKPPLLKTDTPEMRALKESISLKQIDLDKYASRFGVNYPNDKRKLKDDNITSFMLKRMCTNLDMEVDIVFRDAPGDIPNPMGKVVRVNMVPGYSNTAIIEDAEKGDV